MKMGIFLNIVMVSLFIFTLTTWIYSCSGSKNAEYHGESTLEENEDPNDEFEEGTIATKTLGRDRPSDKDEGIPGYLVGTQNAGITCRVGSEDSIGTSKCEVMVKLDDGSTIKATGFEDGANILWKNPILSGSLEELTNLTCKLSADRLSQSCSFVVPVQEIDFGFEVSDDSETTTIETTASSQHLARADFNGDGYSDVLIAAPAASFDNGKVYIYYGGALNTTPADADADVIISGNSGSGAKFAEVISAAGDINGDGKDDVIISAHQHNASGSDRGRVYIFFGGSFPSTLNDTDADVVISGSQSSAWFGNSVTSTGDVNGDGKADVLIGARYNNGGGTDRGKVYIYYGGVLAASLNDTDADVIISGTQNSASFGSSLSSVGDLDADGKDDVIIGAITHNSSGIDRGRVFIIYGSSLAATLMDTDSDVIISGTRNAGWFGHAVSSAGDINDDGNADVVIGAFAYNNSAGKAYIFYGGSLAPSINDDIADVIISGTENSARFGYSVSSAGDVNGDGVNDLIVGAYLHDVSGGAGTNRGQAYVYYGGNLAGVLDDSGADVIISGTENVSTFAKSVSSAGDVDGDGLDDVIISAGRDDANGNGGSNRGQAFMFYGGFVSGDDNDANVIFSGTVDGAHFGEVVAAGF